MPFQSLFRTVCGSYRVTLSFRRENREFACKQAQKHREILAQVEAELHLPRSRRRFSMKGLEE
jgi:hypothetical protein